MRTIFFLPLILVFILGGCGATKEPKIVIKQELPGWYQNPPLSNSATLYAIGEGKNKEEAIANALNYMASTLSISISSSYNAKTTVREGSVSSHEGVYKSDISSDVKKIRISNYEVIQAKSLGFRKYAVLIKSDKQKLFSSLKHEIDQKVALVKANEKNLDDDALGKFLFYKKLNKELENLPHTLVVMKELNSRFDSEVYLQTLKSVDKKYRYYQSNISFSVVSNLANLKAPIAKALSKRNFKVNAASSKMHYKISINTSVTKANAYGFTLARAELRIVTSNYKGANVASNVFHLVGQSSQGYDVAIQDLVRQLNDKIQKDGLDKVLNINI
ncbi:LPP20 family lipoprotein [Sulfurimonas marina]|uniref:Lipoprotein LPP20-like domain-containing protein n=1 Tax=Sulfurimonas marina TaxID=2590551 RepID=A0A7M1AYP4_9BACT|nr:LPP20 family lipoprotein [Sulfurimonas marina]QOP41678.1 hypothetical protein FJR03_07960 [Sulfurimonas marina]